MTLPDYKKIAEKAAKEPIKEMGATDEEVEKTIAEIRKLRARTVTQNEELRTKNAGGTEEGKEFPPLMDENVKNSGNSKILLTFV